MSETLCLKTICLKLCYELQIAWPANKIFTFISFLSGEEPDSSGQYQIAAQCSSNVEKK